MDSTTDDSSVGDTQSPEFRLSMTRPDQQPSPAIAPAFGLAFPTPTMSVPVVASPTPAAFDPLPEPSRSRLPELMGADELAAAPRPFPPPAPSDVAPLVAPPAPEHLPSEAVPMAAALAVTPAPTAGPPPTAVPPWMAAAPPVAVPPPIAVPPAAVPPAAVPQAVAALPPVSVPGPAGDPFALLLAPSSAALAPLRIPSTASISDGEDIGRSTIGEKIVLVLAVIAPPIGLIASIVAAVGSARRRGWVIGLLRAAIAIGLVLSIVVGIVGYIGYKQLRLQQAHDQTVAASAAFCSMLQKDPTMRAAPDFGWPAVATSIPDSIAAMQAYADKWTKLAAVSPPGVAAGVTSVAASAKQIIDSVTVSRTVNDASNIGVMTSAATSSGVTAWYSQYCT